MADDRDYRTPGQFIETLLDERGWSKRVLAIILHADEATINRIISGKQSLHAEMALALGEVFAMPAERFLDLQKAYDLAQARIVARPDPGTIGELIRAALDEPATAPPSAPVEHPLVALAAGRPALRVIPGGRRGA